MGSDSVRLIAQLGGEVITYTPHGGIPKTFRAIVKRRPTKVENVGGVQFTSNIIELVFPRDPIDGVMAIAERKDKVSFKKRLSDAQATEYVINKVTAEDAGISATDTGMFRVTVQA